MLWGIQPTYLADSQRSQWSFYIPFLFQHLTPHSHYRKYILQLQVFQGDGTISKDTIYLPRFGVAFTLQVAAVIGVWQNSPVLKHLRFICDLETQWQNVHLSPLTLCCHVALKDDRVTTLYTLWTTPSLLSVNAHGSKIRGRYFK